MYNVDWVKNNGWATPEELHYSNFLSGDTLGNNYNVIDPFHPSGNSLDVSTRANGGQGGINIDNVLTPTDTITDASNTRWEQLKAAVDNVIYADPNTTNTGTNGTVRSANGVNTGTKKQPTDYSMYWVMGGAIVVLVGTFLIVRKIKGKK